jgi:hypothetical protein
MHDVCHNGVGIKDIESASSQGSADEILYDHLKSQDLDYNTLVFSLCCNPKKFRSPPINSYQCPNRGARDVKVTCKLKPEISNNQHHEWV